MPDKKPQKQVHFLPPLGTLTPVNFLKRLSTAAPEKSLTLTTTLLDKTLEQQTKLNAKAKKAAFLHLDFLVEHYRKRGASMDAFAREIGMSGNSDYARFLISKNPQARNIIDEIAIGFYVGGHRKLFQMFCEAYHASFEVLFTHDRENRYRRCRADLRYNILMQRLQTAYKEAYGKDFQKTLETEFSSDESFTLSP